MSNKVELLVVSVESDDISTKLQVAPEDYSMIYDAVAFKKEYDRETKEWKDSPEAYKRYEEYKQLVGGSFEDLEDKKIELYVDEETGKAYFTEGTSFKKIEKPDISIKRIKQAPIVEVRDSAKARSVVIEHKGKYYAFNYNTGIYVEKLNKFIPNAAKLAKAKARFNEDFEEVNITWENAELAVGLVVDVTVEKNALSPGSTEGWLKPLPLSADDQPKIEEGSEDLPF